MKQKKLKIAIVSDAIYPYNIGGKEKRIYEISTRLAKSGYDVTIYCMKWFKGKGNTRIENGVTLKAISPYYPLYSGPRRSFKQAILFSISTLKLIREDFDIIDADHMPHLVLFPLKIICMLKRKKLYATWNEVWGRRYWKKYLGNYLSEVAYIIELLSARLPDEIIAVSEHTRNKLIKDLKIKKGIKVVTNGIDLDEIKKVKPSKEISDIIYAGRLLKHKNIDVLIKSINNLKKDYPKIKALIIGEGPEKKKLELLIVKYNLSENIKLIGHLQNHTDLYSLFKSSKVFAFPSTREGFGIAALEANACGMPFVTSDHKDNATCQLINGDKNGHAVKLNFIDISKQIKSLLIQKTTKNFDLNKYDWDTIALSVKEVYF